MSLPLEIPVDPDRDEARRQLAEELAKPEYGDSANWWDTFWNRILDWLTGDPGVRVDVPAELIAGIVIGVIAVAAVILLVAAGPLGTWRKPVPTGDMFAGDTRPADDLRAEAELLAGQGQWTQACLQRFRAMIRSFSERVIIEETPGMTASEAVAQAMSRLPSLSNPLLGAAREFDWMAYGGRQGTQASYQALADLDTTAANTVPLRADEAQVVVGMGF
ncbi:MAG: DUF4129 domain-containing protein [Propionibacteriaceae bacterium]|jgi:hypothetical protein|nr:DUF4129 domain-containing protein [Propionibacteriaceae bacterium]